MLNGSIGTCSLSRCYLLSTQQQLTRTYTHTCKCEHNELAVHFARVSFAQGEYMYNNNVQYVMGICMCILHENHVLSPKKKLEIFKHTLIPCDRASWTQCETSLQQQIASSFLLHTHAAYKQTHRTSHHVRYVLAPCGVALTQHTCICVRQVILLSSILLHIRTDMKEIYDVWPMQHSNCMFRIGRCETNAIQLNTQKRIRTHAFDWAIKKIIICICTCKWGEEIDLVPSSMLTDEIMKHVCFVHMKFSIWCVLDFV